MSTITDAQVHAMCAYLADGGEHFGRPVCFKCKHEAVTPYGNGKPGCYGMALETLEKARDILGVDER